jgi:PAS domain S-box-containing protein
MKLSQILLRIALAIVAVCLFLFLFNQTRIINFQQHDRFLSNLLRIKELDALLNQDVVRSRAGLLTYYDPLANNLSELKKRGDRLNEIPSFISKKERNKLKSLIDFQNDIFNQKEQLIESFKTKDAILKNSVYYFPTLTGDLAKNALKSGDKELAERIEQLLKDILVYNLIPSGEIAPKIQGELGVLLTTRNQYSASVNGADLDRVVLHGKSILRNKPVVDALVQEIVSLPTASRGEEIYRLYNQFYEAALQKIALYRIFLTLFYVLLIGGISAYIILRLRKSAQTVTAAKEKLQIALEDTRKAEEKFRQIYENSTDGIFQTTPEGQYLSANPTLASIYGYDSPEELMHSITNIQQQLYVDPQRRSEFIELMKTHNFIAQFESQIYRKDGSITWISENARTVKDANGILLYYEGTVEDISDRKQTEAMLQASETKLRIQQTALMELSRCQPLYSGEIEPALREITETAAYTLGVERVSVWLYNQERSQINCVDLYELNLNAHSDGLILSAQDYPGYFQALEIEERALVADNAYTDPRTKEFSITYLTPLQINSMLDVPIRLGGRTVGVLCLEQVGCFRKWSIEEENFSNYLAYMTSLAMEARDRKQAQEALRIEREKAEMLLLNILPAAIAERLKQHESIADSFEEVSVLFADIVGFTQIASRISPTELVNLLNQIFSIFDQLAEKHNLEKIKTIGDAYMVVAGLPMPRIDHACAIAEMALDMQQAVTNFSTHFGIDLNLRIGINTGPVVAGVIGIKKFIYDLWGDTVNIASRMESQGIAGCIQVTGITYQLLQQQYLLEQRGTIQVKGKGEMITYFLTGRKELHQG